METKQSLLKRILMDKELKTILIIVGVGLILMALCLHSINKSSCDPAIYGNLTSGYSAGYGTGSIDFPCNPDGFFPKIEHNSWGWMDE